MGGDSGRLSIPPIFNLVVYTVVQHYAAVVEERVVGQDGNER